MIEKRIRRVRCGEGLVLFLITAAAALLRLAAIDTLPPGLYHDEACNGLDALRVLQGHTPIFFQANNGREPLFIYALAASVKIWGRSPGALRLVSVAFGTLTVPAIYWLGRELFGRTEATLAAILASTTVWTLNLSRVAFRAVTMVPIQAIALALLWRGLRKRSPSLMVWAGIAYGFSFYTYLAARFSIVALIAIVLYLAALHRELLWARGFALFAGVALVVTVPLALYFATQVQSPLGRMGQVSIFSAELSGGDPWGLLLRQTARTLSSFFYRGDFIPRHNVPERPVYDPVAGLAFLVGAVLSLRWAKGRAPYGLCLIWLVVMLFPTILAEGAPHMLRASGILPFLFFPPAWAFAAALREMGKRGAAKIGHFAIAAALAASSLNSTVVYARHLSSEAVYYNFEAGATELAAAANRFMGSGWTGQGIASRSEREPRGDVWIAPRLWQGWSSIRYLSPSVRVLPGQDGADAALPGDRDLMLILWPYDDLSPALRLLPPNRLISAREGARERGDLEAESRLLYVTVTASDSQKQADATVWNTAPAEGVWEQGIRLLGHHLDSDDGSGLAVKLYWATDAPTAMSYTVFCHVLCANASGKGWRQVGQHDGPPALGYYGTDRWRVGDIVEDRHPIELVEAFDQRSCEVRVGLYHWPTMKRLRLLDDRGQPGEHTELRLP